MNCPKCRKDSLVPAPSGGDNAFVCNGCRGWWVSRELVESSTAHYLLEGDDGLPSTSTEADLRTGLCPHGHGLMIRARIDLAPRFYLERCPHCGGIWFDRGEWDRVADACLLENLPRLWSLSWQRRQRAAESRAKHMEWANERFGAQLMADLEALAGQLAEHPMRQQALAFLREESRASKG